MVVLGGKAVSCQRGIPVQQLGTFTWLEPRSFPPCDLSGDVLQFVRRFCMEICVAGSGIPRS